MVWLRLGSVLVAVAALAVACGQQGPDSAGKNAVSYTASAPVGPCGAVTQQHPIEGATHVDVCSYVDYHTNPPSSGNHYMYWAQYMTYDQPVPEGYWVHNLEHGSIVLTYNCGEAGCAGDIAAAQQMMDQFPVDPLCTADGEGVRHRLVMTPDPHLEVRFAASAWGWTLRANCFDTSAFLAFANAHYAQGTEPLCNNGIDVIGTSGDPAGCGDPPGSSAVGSSDEGAATDASSGADAAD
jgi:Protein of unknown function (DUF3105)